MKSLGQDHLLDNRLVQRWNRSTRCRRKHENGCPHVERHWHPKGRADVQGLRAFAVIAVIVDHLTGWPGGGFVGVDIFFVISGFLITGLLLREHERTGRISWTGFYRRRIRRILPAAALVLTVSVVAAHFAFNAPRAKQTLLDAAAALFFGANWRFQHLATNYFAANRPVSPDQHFWSLSIEEQFYFIWPWLMLLIFVLMGRAGRSRSISRVVVGALLGVLCVASFVYAIHETNVDVNGAYFASLGRAWELGLGALLAVAAPLCHRIPDAVRPVLAWVGVAGMVSAVFFVRSSHGFPAPAAAWPVLATAMVIAAGTYADRKRQQRFLGPLTNRVCGYIGDISYSLYLWHFPLIVITLAYVSDGTRTRVLLVPAIAALSIFSYHLVEDPIRRGRVDWRSYRNVALTGAVVAVLAESVIAVRPVHPPQSALAKYASLATLNAPATSAATEGPALAALQKQMKTALGATSWPSLSPSIDQAISSPEALLPIRACGTASVHTTLSQCIFGNPHGTRTVVTVGDSISLTYTGALDVALRKSDWRVIPVGSFGCPFTDANYHDLVGMLNQACPVRKQQAIATISQLKPNVVIFSNLSTKDGVDENGFATQFTKELRKVARFTPKIVLLTTPPEQPSFSDCYTPHSVPADCSAQVSDGFSRGLSQLQTVASSLPHAAVVDTSDLFCYEGTYCPPFVGQTPMFIDGRHMTPAYQQKVAPALLELLRARGVLGAGA